jgi:hypothetical protein
MWNLENFTSQIPTETTITGCLFQMHISCSTCSPPIKSFAVYAYRDHFELFLIRYCPHQQWTVSKQSPHQKRYQSPDQMPMHDFPNSHPFRIFGKYILKNYSQYLNESEIEFLKAHCYSLSAQYIHRLLEKHVDSLESLINHTTGKFILFCREPKQNPLLIYKSMDVCQLTYIYPFALSILQQAEYFELDASFQAIDSFIYSVILVIISNESFPIGLQISPSEKALHYSTFFDEIRNLFPEIVLEGRDYLSDQGKQLIGFVKSIEGNHHFCYRHILENLGSDSFAAIIVQRMLWCSTLEEYSNLLPQAFADLHQLVIADAITPNQVSIITALFEFDFHDSYFIPQDQFNISYPQALWSRKEKGISTCSNHVERLHRTINAKTKRINDRVTCIGEILKVIDDRFKSAAKFNGRQGKEKFKSLQKLAEQLNLPPIDDCPVAGCGWSEIYSKRFGVNNFPCIHMVKKATLNTPEKKSFSNFTEKSICDVKLFEHRWTYRGYKKNQDISSSEETVEQTDEENVSDETIMENENESNEEFPFMLASNEKFLWKLTKEVMKIRKLKKQFFQSKLIELSIEWGRKVSNMEGNIDEETLRAEFSYEKWRMS